MTVHLIKLCVGTEDVGQLARYQAMRLDQARNRGEVPRLRHVTRNTPKRADEILDGGSLYWVIRRLVQVRQRIIGIEAVRREDGRPACALILHPQLVRTEVRRFRPFQGWRYLPAEEAPFDLPDGDGAVDDVPAAMAAELRELGLL